ncbi:hypothetical protein ACLB1G_12700 [Oxalobacteraceae bacterium A2-2]
MKDINPKPKSICDLFEEAGRAFMGVLRHAMRTLQRMSWPAILVACLALAFILTILPLAITLFVAFMLVKVAIALFAVKRYKQAPTEYHQ